MKILDVFSNAKRRFFLFDILISSFWALFVFRLWSSSFLTILCVENYVFEWWMAPVVLYIVFARLGVSIMMLRNDKNGLWVSIPILICGIICLIFSKNVLSNAIFDSYNYINMCSENRLCHFMHFLQKLVPIGSYEQTVKATWHAFLFIWVWGLPLAYFLIRRKKCTQSNVSLRKSLFGLYLFNDSVGRFYLKIVAFVLVALFVGIVMNTILSLIGMLLLSFYLYWIIGKWEVKKVSVLQWIFITASMVLFWTAQYQTGTRRMLLLVASVLLSGISVVLLYHSYKMIHRQIAWIVICGILLPSVCLGYNVFALTDYSRGEKLQAQFNVTGVIKMKDAQGHIGLRDRYRQLIPVLYSDIEDYHLPYLKVKKNNLWGVWDTEYEGHTKGDYDQIIMGPDNRKVSSYEEMCLFAKIEFTSIEPIQEDCIYFRCRKGTLGGIGSLYPCSVPYLIQNPDAMIFANIAPYFDIIKNDTMHCILDENLHLAYSDSVAYAKKIDSLHYQLVYKENFTGNKHLCLPEWEGGHAETY